MNKILLLLATHFGIATADKDETALIAEVEPKIPELLAALQSSTAELATTKGTLTQAQTDLTAAQAKVTELEAKATDSPALIALAESTLTKQRAEVCRLAALVSPTHKVDPNVKTLVDTAPPQTLEVLLNTYQAQADEKFPLSCKSCGSHEVSRQSSRSEEAPDPAPQKKDLRQLMEERSRLAGVNRVHGEKPKA